MGLAIVTSSESAVKSWQTKSSVRPYGPLSSRKLEERNHILMEHLPQVRYIARRIHNRLPRFIPLEDLVQSGVLGLIDALHNFDRSKNVQLKSYAKSRIRGAILDSLRELDWGPRTLRRKARQIASLEQELSARLGRRPSDSEISANLGIALTKFQRLVSELHGLEVISLQAAVSDDGYGGEERRSVPQTADDPSSLCLRSEMNSLLRRALCELPRRNRQVLTLYYLEELTMKEVGVRLGVGESRVSQIHSAALARLRTRVRQILESHNRQKTGAERGRRASPKIGPVFQAPCGAPRTGTQAASSESWATISVGGGMKRSAATGP